ncbi:MAG: rhodanese-like domain-containing protein [Rhizomicrobium sp.]
MVNNADYAGDVTSAEAWAVLRGEPKAQLIDVRTAAEWAYVGLPDLSGLGRELHRVEWQIFPSMAVNPDFAALAAEKVRHAGADEQTPLLFLCRSGARSRAAAIAMTRAGFAKSFNIMDGFEGDLDAERHRGRHNGWKAANLPWRQS